MNKLWVFGDSFSASNKRKNNIESWRASYAQWKGYVTNTWPDFLSKSIKHKLINCAISGTDNYTIFDTIIDVIDKIDKDDVVIIGWSSILRFRIIDKYNSFSTIRPNDIDRTDKFYSKRSTLGNSLQYNHISLDTINEILVNRDNILYQHEVNRFIKIINLYLDNKCKIMHWSPFQYNHQTINITYIEDLSLLERISDETSGVISDRHYSENGNKLLAEKIYNLLYE